MRLLLALALLVPVNSSAAKILFELGGKQQLVDVKVGGGVCPECVVLWNTEIDGNIPENAPIGYADRVTDPVTGELKLVPNDAKKAAMDTEAAAKTKAEAALATARAALKTLKAKIKAKTATASEVRDAIGLALDALNLGN